MQSRRIWARREKRLTVRENAQRTGFMKTTFCLSGLAIAFCGFAAMAQNPLERPGNSDKSGYQNPLDRPAYGKTGRDYSERKEFSSPSLSAPQRQQLVVPTQRVVPETNAAKDAKRLEQQALQAEIEVARIKQREITNQLSKVAPATYPHNLYEQREANDELIRTKQAQINKSKFGK